MRTVLPLVLISAMGLSTLSGRAETKISPKSVSADLPVDSRMFPEGPGSDAANNNCLACHSAGMILNQPALTRAEWEAEVNKMREAYKAPVDPKDIGAIVGYLVSINGR